MSGSFPIQEYCSGQTETPFSVTVTPSATAHTKGAWSQIIASTAYDAQLMHLYIEQYSVQEFAYDIGIGTAGSEKVIINNLAFSTQAIAVSLAHGSIVVPLSIPAGSRLAVRCQADTASQPADNFVNMQLFDSGFSSQSGFAGIDSLGFTTSTTRGTTVKAGATVYTKGTYAQIIASTTRDYVGFFIAVPNNTQVKGIDFLLTDIAVGGAGAENIIIPDIPLWCTPVQYLNLTVCQWSAFYPVPVPAGQRLAARTATNIASTSNGQIVLYGVYQ